MTEGKSWCCALQLVAALLSLVLASATRLALLRAGPVTLSHLENARTSGSLTALLLSFASLEAHAAGTTATEGAAAATTGAAAAAGATSTGAAHTEEGAPVLGKAVPTDSGASLLLTLIALLKSSR